MNNSNSISKNKALFLDRDGVVCEALNPNDGKNGYLIKPEECELLPGIKELVTSAKEKGYVVVVVSNQPQIAKGLLKEGELARVHLKIQNLLDNKIDKIYHCPHKDEDNCDCRKPKAGMLKRAAEELNIDCTKSVMVGDGDKDIFAGQAVGCKTIFIKNKFKEQYLANCSPDYTVTRLSEVIPLI
ncbi:MAG: HAD family hydrolase [Candidatus Jorgensenbacteria bacterium]|nr:HAD family hydrolase [Candidatus Jorgensenbacteria bacterium]